MNIVKSIEQKINSLYLQLLGRSIKRQLITFFLVIALLPLLLVGLIAADQSQDALREEATNKLLAVRNQKARQVANYFENVEEYVRLTAQLNDVELAAINMRLSSNVTTVPGLRALGYLGRPERLVGDTTVLDDGTVIGITYINDHAVYHNFFREVIAAQNFDDIIMVTRAGDVIYTYAKRDEFGTNLIDGPYQNSSLAQLFDRLENEGFIGQVLVTDYELYAPADNAPVLFMGTPIADVTGQAVAGYLFVGLNLSQIEDLMADVTGLGTTGATYLVGEDGKIRSSNGMQSEPVRLAAAQEALAGAIASTLTLNKDGVAVLSAYQPVAIADFQWALLAEQFQSEAFQAANNLRFLLLALIVVTGLVVIAIAFFITNRLVRPITHLTTAATLLAQGDLDQIVAVERQDELGVLGNTFNSMAGQLRDVIGSLEEQVAARTQRLETVATLNEQLAAILNVEQVLDALVQEVKSQFGYYHVHVYRLESPVSGEVGQEQMLVVAAGSGSAGAEMKASRHSIPLNARTSLVARAARSRQIVREDNVQETADWLPNPLLPDTYAEMAVPIVVDSQVVGVLDVQENKIAGLDEGDAGLLRSLANQVAIAIRNARLFEQVETALAEAHTAQERYLQDGWAKTRIQRQVERYAFARAEGMSLSSNEEQALSQARQQALADKRAALVRLSDDQGKGQLLAAPIQLRDQTIGALQLYAGGDSKSWSQEELGIIESVMDQFSQTAENLRLFDETRRQAGQEQALREITEKLRAAPNLQQLLDIATQELSQRLLATHTRLELGIDPDVVQSNGDDEIATGEAH